MCCILLSPFLFLFCFLFFCKWCFNGCKIILAHHHIQLTLPLDNEPLYPGICYRTRIATSTAESIPNNDRYRLLATICQTATNCSKFSKRKGLTIWTPFRRTQLNGKDDNRKAGFQLPFSFKKTTDLQPYWKHPVTGTFTALATLVHTFLKSFLILSTHLWRYTDTFKYIYCCLI